MPTSTKEEDGEEKETPSTIVRTKLNPNVPVVSSRPGAKMGRANRVIKRKSF